MHVTTGATGTVLVASIVYAMHMQVENTNKTVTPCRDRSAFDSGDLGSYMEKTTPGMVGSLQYCEAPYEEWRGAMLSFPSSHASLSFSGLLLLSLYLSRKFTPSLASYTNITATLAYKVRLFFFAALTADCKVARE